MPKTITSHRNQHVKDAVLLRDRRGRSQQGRIIIDGAREMLRAIKGGVKFVEVFVCPELCDSEDCHLAIGALSLTSASILTVTPEVFGRIAFGQRSEGIVGLATMPQQTLADLSLSTNPLVVVVEGVEKPGNVGAVIRSADGAGAAAVVVANPHMDLFNPNSIRASMGTVFTLPVRGATSDEAITWLRSHGIQMFAAMTDGVHTYTAQDFTGPAALILGNEVSGLSTTWQADDITPIRLPMCGAADSLNVAATAAVLVYEVLRQREAKTDFANR